MPDPCNRIGFAHKVAVVVEELEFAVLVGPATLELEFAMLDCATLELDRAMLELDRAMLELDCAMLELDRAMLELDCAMLDCLRLDELEATLDDPFTMRS